MDLKYRKMCSKAEEGTTVGRDIREDTTVCKCWKDEGDLKRMSYFIFRTLSVNVMSVEWSVPSNDTLGKMVKKFCKIKEME